MDLTILKKKISSYRTPKGRITTLPDELLAEILHAWEQWTTAPSGFYTQLGVDYRKMGSLMGRAKKLKREGAFDGIDFTEVIIEQDEIPETKKNSTHSSCGIELVYKDNLIRFGTCELLMDFLKKVA